MKNLFLFVCFFFSAGSFGQLLIDDSLTVSQLVQTVLVDSSVQPSNIMFNSEPGNATVVQVSRFSTGSTATNLGLDQGLILATADAHVAIGPNNQEGASTFAFGGSHIDNDLILIPGANFLESSSVLEFDFVATGSELNFDFIFASEEYPEYSNSTYNDVFGFFLSGPGISGPYSNNAKNIALIPGTNTEVTINNLNNGATNNGPCEYCEFYVNNGTGLTPNSNPHVQYDGFTSVIRASSGLICGETYHIKLAIGNVGDNTYDSAVFIKNFNIRQSLELVDDNDLTENLDACLGQNLTLFSGLRPEGNIFVWTKDGAVIPETGPNITISEGGLYAVNVFTEDGCHFAFDDILIVYRTEMSITDPPDINLCAVAAPSYTFPTINQTSTILGTLNPAHYSVSYYNSSYQDAVSGSLDGLIPMTSLDNYTISTATGVIWVRVEETGPEMYGCVEVISFNINAYGIQTGDISYAKDVYCTDVTTPQPVMSTASAGGVFSATPSGLQLDAITGAITPSGSAGGNYAIIYSVPATGSCPAYSTPAAYVTMNSVAASQPTVVSPVLYCKDDTVQPLIASGANLLWYQSPTGGTGSTIQPVPNADTTGTTIYYVSQNVGGCESERAAITVIVSPIPAPPSTATATYCLNAAASPLTANGTGLLWYDSAVAPTGSPIAPVPDTSSIGSQLFYVSQTVNGCESLRTALTVEVVLISPDPQVTSPIRYCLNENVTRPLSAIGNNLLWYDGPTGGVGTAQPPLPDSSSAGLFNYYVSQNTTGCESNRAIITVEVVSTAMSPVAEPPLTYCQGETAVPLVATGTSLKWYTVATGGVGSNNAPIPQTADAGTTTYYASQTVDGCESPRSSIDVTVLPAVVFSLPQDGILCSNNSSIVLRSLTLATGLNPSSYKFEWYEVVAGTNQIIDGATSSSLEVSEPGNYGVIAEDLITGCRSQMIMANISPVHPPSDFSFTASNYFADPTSLSIEVVPAGSYEYKIDEGAFQESASFSNIAYGPHTVAVRDVNHCATLTKELFFVNFPKFFTPNGDGYNDIWNIKDLDKQLNARIHIFDRFGRLLKEIFPSGTGWDGTFNENDMPSTDYWFIIYYEEHNESKEFRSHFSLKR